MEAKLFEAHALLRAPSPWARGVLSRFGAAPRPLRVGVGADLPRCHNPVLSPAGSAWLCLDGARARLLDPMHPERGEVTVDGVFTAAAFAEEGRMVLADADARLSVWEPPAAPRRLEGRPLFSRPTLVGGPDQAWIAAIQSGADWAVPLDGGPPLRRETCAGAPVATAPRVGGATWVAYGGGRVLRLSPSGEPTLVHTLTRDDGDPSRVFPLPDGGVLVGTVKGHLLALGPDGAVRTRAAFGDDAITELRVSGPRAIVRSGDGLGVWELDGAGVVNLPDERGSAAAWRPDGALRTVSARAEDRRTPYPARAVTVALPEGVACLAFSPDGREVAVGTGDGTVSIVDRATGRVSRACRPLSAVVKDLAWSPAGDQIALASASPAAQLVLDTATGAERARMRDVSARRVVWGPAGTLWATYRVELLRWAGADGLAPVRTAQVLIAELEQAGAIVALDMEGGLFRVSHEGVLAPLATVPGAISIVPVGARVYVGTETALIRVDPQGTRSVEAEVTSPIMDLAVSPDGALLALAHVDGTVSVRRPGASDPLAILDAHRARVSAVAFSPDGTELVTGSWDGTVRFWAIPPIEADPGALVAGLEAAWGRALADVLDPVR